MTLVRSAPEEEPAALRLRRPTTAARVPPGGWGDTISDHAIGSCQPQRTEFRRSARNLDEYEQMTSMFVDLYPDVAVPKTAWQWVESAQYRLLRAGAHQALSCVDLLICACAAIRGIVILHDDNNYVTAARHLPDLAERRVQSPAP
jgi:predicted nucleic acid-binding protein